MAMGMNLLIVSFAIIAAATLLQCTEGNVILAGEDTPVWTARCNHPKCDNKDNPVSYKRLNKDIIKRAFDYWKSDRFENMSFSLKRSARSTKVFLDNDDKRDSNEFGNPQYSVVELESLVVNRTRSKRQNVLDRYQYGTVEASVLVMVDFDASKVTDDASRRKFVKEKILYVLAYWNSFNTGVWEIKGIKNKPHVQVKLVGIIIGLDRGATPYISTSLTAQDSLRKANTFWRNPPHTDFPRDSYHAVATMTDVEPSGSYGFFETVVEADFGNSPSVLVWDKPNFRALRRKAPIYYKEVGDFLRQWADEYPKVYDHMKPGKRVEKILPGMLMTPAQQCVTWRYNDFERTCPEKSTDCTLWCKNSGWLHFCGSVGAPLDGTPCHDGKVG